MLTGSLRKPQPTRGRQQHDVWPFKNRTETGSTCENPHLIEFKAGRLNMVGKMVHPDHRKGL